jgi:hypothetical protein
MGLDLFKKYLFLLLLSLTIDPFNNKSKGLPKDERENREWFEEAKTLIAPVPVANNKPRKRLSCDFIVSGVKNSNLGKR